MVAKYYEISIPTLDKTMEQAFDDLRFEQYEEYRKVNPDLSNYDILSGNLACKYIVKDITKLIPPNFIPNEAWRKNYSKLNGFGEFSDPFGYEMGGRYIFFGDTRV